MKIFIYHTPEETPTENMPDCAIAVDVLRATTTMATAIYAGAEAVHLTLLENMELGVGIETS